MNELLDRLFLVGKDLRAAADSESSSDVFAVGGMLCDLGLVATPAGPVAVPCRAFGRWLELTRRERALTLQQIAERTGADLHELVQIEDGEAARITPRTVYQLAALFGVDARQLAILAGLIQDRPGGPLTQAAVRFAAQSEPMDKLTRIEQEALNEFVRFLESSER